jgi:hypothetical protein
MPSRPGNRSPRSPWPERSAHSLARLAPGWTRPDSPGGFSSGDLGVEAEYGPVHPAAPDQVHGPDRRPTICSFALGMAGQVACHLMAQAGMARAPWAITTVVSCLPVLVLAMGTALAHMLRADAEATDAPDNRTGPRAVLRSLTWSAQDQDRPGRRQPEADRDRSVSRGQTGPKPGRQGGRGIRAPDPRPAQPRAAQGRLVARRLAAAGRPVSRRALRGAAVTGSNQALNALARRINAGQAGATPPEPISPG